ncbi:MAG: IS66 family transposase [Victivallales bacterium]|nr:IS66 family transposase [Victivallales bacterium]
MPEHQSELEQYRRRCEEQASMLESLTKANAALTGTIGELRRTIEELKETIRELQRQLGRNSRNSSQPPSKDGFDKPRPRSQRKRSGLKPGGQSGHAGSHMAVPHEPDEVQRHLPSKCLCCRHLAECREKGNVFTCGERRYEVNVVVGTKVTEHQSLEAAACPYGEAVRPAVFPENIRAHVQYGDSVTVLAGLLNTYGAVSVNRIHTLLGSLMGVGLSTGTIASMVSQCASKVGGTLDAIREMLAKEAVVNFDETGTDVNGKTVWVHNSSTKALTYQTISARRGQEGMEGNGVLPGFRGIGVHDCWKPYWKYELAGHAVCCAHLLRELTGIEEFQPDHGWPARFKALLMDMKKAKERTMDRGADGISRYYWLKFDAEYDRILEEAEAVCPEPPDPPDRRRGRKKKGKERSLIERLKSLKDSVCMFLHNFIVPFDNNQAERDVRNVKTKTKVSGCFRTEAGAQDYLDIMSYLSTGMKHGVSVFDALTAAFAGNGAIVLR